MHKKEVKIAGILLLLLLAVTMIGLLTPKSETTGFAVKRDKCFEGTAFGECSSVQPKYCDKGALKPDCQRCGCSSSEVCQADGTCLQKCSDGTLYGQCSENKPTLCYKGSLLQNCFECGCSPNQACQNDGTCADNAGIGAGSEEVTSVEDAVEEEIEVVEVIEPVIEEEELKPEIKEKPKVSFWKHLFCRIFYFKDYDICIS